MGLWKKWRESKRLKEQAKDEARIRAYEVEQESSSRDEPERVPLAPYRDEIGQGPYINPF